MHTLRVSPSGLSGRVGTFGWGTKGKPGRRIFGPERVAGRATTPRRRPCDEGSWSHVDQSPAVDGPESPASILASSSSEPIRIGPLNHLLAETTHQPPNRMNAPPTVSGA